MQVVLTGNKKRKELAFSDLNNGEFFCCRGDNSIRLRVNALLYVVFSNSNIPTVHNWRELDPDRGILRVEVTQLEGSVIL